MDALFELDGGSLRARAEATDARAATLYWQRDILGSMDVYRELLELFGELGDIERVGDTWFALSAASNFTEAYDDGQVFSDRAIAMPPTRPAEGRRVLAPQ